MATTEIKFGDKVRDTVTGFTGTVTGRAEYANGQRQLLAETLRTDGGTSAEWLDTDRVELVGQDA